MSRVKVTCCYKEKRGTLELNKRWTLEFDETMTVYDVKEYMEQKNYIPQGLSVRHIKTSPWYPDVYDGAELLFYDPSPEEFGIPTLYGCPSVKDILGSVPSCMLNTFEGFVLLEL